jgi:uncharacterized protein
MSSENITNEKTLIVAFPSVGLVGAFAVSYLVKQLKMETAGELEFTKISPTYVIQKGQAYGPTQIYKKDNVYAVLAGIPLSSALAYDLVKKSIEFAKSNGIGKIIIPRGMEITGNVQIKPTTYGLVVNSNSKSLLDEYNLPLIPSATVYGADAGVISALKNSEVPSIVLYTICRMMLPDADAIVKAIETIASFLKVNIDTEKFEEKLEKLSKENQRLIEQTRKSFEKSTEKSAAMPLPGVG